MSNFPPLIESSSLPHISLPGERFEALFSLFRESGESLAAKKTRENRF